MDFEDRYFVVGPEGFDLQPMAKFPSGVMDDFANTLLKDKFDQWCHKKYCSLSQRFSFVELQYLIRSHLRYDGEVILREFTKGDAVKGNPFGYTLDFVDPNDIDHDYSTKIDDNNFVVMGVHVDRFRRLKGIFLKKKDIYNEFISGFNSFGERDYISADELIFGFDPFHYKQLHGVTSLAYIMLIIYDESMWQNYVMQNAKKSAANTGFLERDINSPFEYNGSNTVGNTEESTSTTDLNDTDREDLIGYDVQEGGSFEALPPGWKMNVLKPEFPSGMHETFTQINGRRIFSGV